MIFNWNDSKSPQVSRTLLGILADINNAVVWMVSSRPLVSKSSSTSTNPLVTVPNAPITIGIIVTLMFHSFFCSLARSKCLSLSFSSVLLCKSPLFGRSSFFLFFSFFFFFLLTISRFGCLAEIRRSVCISKSQRIFYVCFSWTGSGLCLYHLFV